MKMHDATNERVKRQFLTYLKEAKGYSENSLDGTAKALHRFEEYTRFRDFRRFHIQQAVGFRHYLSKQTNLRTGNALSKATMLSTLNALRAFFQWLAGQPGYKSRVKYTDAEYFALSEKDTRIARTKRERRVPTLEQIRHVISNMPSDTEIARRDRALIAFAILTGARDGAIASVKLKHVDLIEKKLEHDGREMRTKFSKTFTTYFFPVGDDFLEPIVDWVGFLRTEKLWSDDDPLFPKTQVALGTNRQFEVLGLARAHWSNAGPIRAIFRRSFKDAGLPYANPHSFRATLAGLAEKLCHSPEEFKSWSQNLGHESVLTTFRSYGEVTRERQAELIRALAQSPKNADELSSMLEAAAAIARHRKL
jgi:integrase